MRVLFAIPHYYKPKPAAENPQLHGSSGLPADRRVASLAACLIAIRQTFGGPQVMIDIARRVTVPANHGPTPTADVVVCTTGPDHLLDRLPIGSGFYTHKPTTAAPLLLGFECHEVLKERRGSYDFYCYLEDDLIIRDPLFFAKLRWFVTLFGPDAVLMPNRFEASFRHHTAKAYVDGPIRPRATAKYQDVTATPELAGEGFGTRWVFRRATNPHSGGFFLSAEQMARWSASSHFLDRDTGFIGPLESAASLGVMRTFRVYKTIPEQAGFLEIEHHTPAFLGHIKMAPPAVPPAATAAS